MKSVILSKLLAEKNAKMKGGLYHKTKINLSYNSNKIEGSKISQEQTRYIFEIRTIGFKEDPALPVDDIIETSNHFVAFNKMLERIDEKLSNDVIIELYETLKTSTFRCKSKLSEKEQKDIEELNNWYLSLPEISFDEIIKYYDKFVEKWSGQIGRLVMFRECLRNSIVPFIVKEQNENLIDTCKSAQDEYKTWVKYFYPEIN
jgi:hypothetical protein